MGVGGNRCGVSTFIDPANKLLAEIVADSPNAITADWHDAATAQPETRQSDQTHPNMEGMHLFTQTVQGAFQDLSDRISALEQEK